MGFTKEIHEKLLLPFDESEVKFKPIELREGKALALPYIDARTVIDKLDDVVGPENWHDEYEVVSPNQVICKLTIFGITKSDAGMASDSDKEPLKAAVSDALKRAAVKFGIGRYLYRLPKMWGEYDKRRNEFVKKPSLKMDNFKAGSKTEEISKKEDNLTEMPPTGNFKCEDCKEDITARVAVFSKKFYKKSLCMKCQSSVSQPVKAKQ